MAQYFKDETIGDLEKLLQQAKGPHSRFEPIWFLNNGFYLGDQWLFWNRGRLDRPRLDPWRLTLIDNRIQGIVMKDVARMTKQRPTWQVTPTTADDGDLDASRVGEKVMDFLWAHLQMRTKLEDALLWSRILCGGFWKPTWDSAKGKSVDVVLDSEGQAVRHAETGEVMRPEDFQGQIPEGLQKKTVALGDVNLEVVSPFEFYPDPIARELGECEWCMQVALKSTEYVKAHFGVEIPPDADVAPGPTEARLFPAFQISGGSGYKAVRLHEYWSRPNSRDPQGKRAVWVKNRLLAMEPNPYEDLPYEMFRGVPVPGRFWPSSVTEQLRGPQSELNKLESQILENVQRIGNPALLCSRQANIQYKGTPGERIDYDDNVQNAVPSYLQAPNLPPYMVAQIERVERSMQEISGQHEVTNAQVPAGVKAASAINLLQEADDTRLGPAIADMETALSRAGTKMLKIVAKYWTDERMLMVAGEDEAWDMMLFRGAALKENTHVEVISGSAFPRSKAAKQAAMQDVLNLILQYGGAPVEPRVLRKFLRSYEAGGLEEMFAQITTTEAQVNRENQILAQGEPRVINAFDEHEVHIQGHEEFQRSAAYERLPAQPHKRNFEEHVFEHREQVLAKIAGPNAIEPPGQQQIPMTGGPPQNGTPPGPPQMPAQQGAR